MAETTLPWIEIRDRGGKLLFKYNLETNVIEIKKGGEIYILVKLDEIREKHGYAPVAVNKDCEATTD